MDHTNDLDHILLYGYEGCRFDISRTIKFCVDSKRFGLPLL